MSEYELVLIYGFEFENIILFTNKSNICKSINNNNPIYCSIMIKDSDMFNIIRKIKMIESKHEYYLSFIDDMASMKELKPKWQLALYNKEFNNYIRGLQGHPLIMNYSTIFDECT